MQQLKDNIIKAILSIKEDKLKKNIFPTFANELEIFKQLPNVNTLDIKRMLRELCKEKKVQFGRQMNNFYFIVIP